MPSCRPLRLLIVEDEPGDARLMELAMQRNGHVVELHNTRDGHEALRFLRREGRQFSQARRPDLILLDLKMPGLSGLEFLTTMKQDQALRTIPVVVITTSTLDADVAAAYQKGAAGYISKPNDINEFVAAIRQLGEYWFKLVRLPENAE